MIILECLNFSKIGVSFQRESVTDEKVSRKKLLKKCTKGIRIGCMNFFI